MLPERPRSAAASVVPPLEAAAGLHLGAGRWVCVVQDAAGSRWTVPLVLDGAHDVRRAVPGDGVAQALAALISSPAESASAPFRLRRWSGRPAHGERGITVDQTNESVVVGEAAVVKWCTHLPAVGCAGEHPAPRRLETLAVQGFSQTPTPWGVLEVDLGDAAPLVLATVADFVPDTTDGWQWAVDEVTARALGHQDEDAVRAPADELGRLTAGLHVALATAGVTPASADQVQGWAARAMATLDEAVSLVDGDEGARLRAMAPRARRSLAALGDLAGTPLIDIHGDLHVGQVLRQPGPAAYRYVVTDFDGNPVLLETERAQPAPAALDVASMMASLDHVGRIVLRRLGDDGPARARVTSWITAAEATFLEAYRGRLSAAGRRELLDERALHPLRVQQECREFVYAARHLPHWRYVPDAALAALLSTDIAR